MRQTNRRTPAGRTKAVNVSINFNCFVMCTVQVSHPNLFVFLGRLHRGTVDYMTDKRRAERGLPIRRPRRKRQQNNDARLLRSCDKYDSGPDVWSSIFSMGVFVGVWMFVGLLPR